MTPSHCPAGDAGARLSSDARCAHASVPAANVSLTRSVSPGRNLRISRLHEGSDQREHQDATTDEDAEDVRAAEGAVRQRTSTVAGIDLLERPVDGKKWQKAEERDDPPRLGQAPRRREEQVGDTERDVVPGDDDLLQLGASADAHEQRESPQGGEKSPPEGADRFEARPRETLPLLVE